LNSIPNWTAGEPQPFQTNSNSENDNNNDILLPSPTNNGDSSFNIKDKIQGELELLGIFAHYEALLSKGGVKKVVPIMYLREWFETIPQYNSPGVMNDVKQLCFMGVDIVNQGSFTNA
jgi:hypothetical protein